MAANLHAAATRIATKANDCCNRSDGYEESVAALALAELMAAYDRGRYDQRILDDLTSPAGKSQAGGG